MQENDKEATQITISESDVVPVNVSAEARDPAEQDNVLEYLKGFSVQHDALNQATGVTPDVQTLEEKEQNDEEKKADKPSLRCRFVSFLISISLLGLWIYLSIDLDESIDETEDQELCRYPGLKIMNKIVLGSFVLAAVVSLCLCFSMMMEYAGFVERKEESSLDNSPTHTCCRVLLILVIAIFALVFLIITYSEDCGEVNRQDETDRVIGGTFLSVWCVSGIFCYYAFHLLCFDNHDFPSLRNE